MPHDEEFQADLVPAEGDDSQGDGSQSGRRWLTPAVIFSLVMVLASAAVFADWWSAVPESVMGNYVGRNRCMDCHREEAKKFAGSHHDLAMDLATEETVLGDFAEVEFTHHDVKSRLFRRDDKFMIHTEGSTGEMEDFEIKYVFGVDPIQQYMVEFDQSGKLKSGEVGRVQVLRISWDVHGKKWFYLPPPDVAEKLEPSDDLHWTGVAQRWNNMCADCHSTDLHKNFDVKTASYHTTFSEIDVSCEACHGPGSVHVELAESKSLFWDRKRGYGLAKLKGADTEPQIQSCAQCHSRRRKVHPDFKAGEPFFDHYATELASNLTYFSDGQIMDEVYVHGSFLQSKMYHKEIRCTDCHDPHTARLKHDGNQLCVSCHTHSAGKYDGPVHHNHRSGSTGASCVECHMPETTYMELDPRRDHSIRIPRPDLSVDFGLPNACVRCHFDEKKLPTEQRDGKRQYIDYVRAASEDEVIRAEINRLNHWSLDAVKKWYPDSKVPQADHWGEYLKQAWDGEPESAESLLKVIRKKSYPAFIRATALSQLAGFGEPVKNSKAVQRHLEDPHPLVRMAAVSVFEPLMPRLEMGQEYREDTLTSIADDLRPRIEELLLLLDDESRLVRAEAARVLSAIDYRVSRLVLEGEERDKMMVGLEELRVGVMENRDRGGAHAMMGNIYANLGWYKKAEQAYKSAVHVEPAMTGPRTNLAELMDYHEGLLDREARRYAQARNMSKVEEIAGEIATYRIRAERYRAEELPNIARDARLAPDNAPIIYRYAMSLYVNERLPEAEQQLDRALELEPRNPQYLLMQGLLQQKFKNYDRALELINRLIKEVPGNEQYEQLWREIRAEKDAPPAARMP